MTTSFTFNGRLAITLQIGGHDITVVGTADLEAAASMTLEYKAPSFDEGFVLGTFEEAMGHLVDAVSNLSLGSGGSGSSPLDRTNLTAEVTRLREAAARLPGFQQVLGDATRGIAAAQVRLTELTFDLEAVALPPGAPPSSANDLRGSLSIGLALDFRSSPPTLPGVGIAVKTVTLYVRLGVNR